MNLMTKEKISVIIPVKNEEDKIESCLKSLSIQTLRPYEIIVVVGNSTDNTVEKAKKYPVKIFYETYGTVGGARQVGLENAKGDFIAFTDADCIPEKDWLETELNVLKKNKNAAGVGCSIENVSKGKWEEAINELSKTFIGSGRSIQGRQFKKEKKVLSISGCNSLYRKQTLYDIGGFNVKLNICEDTEINKRLRKQGYDLIYTPKTKVLHNHTRGIKLFTKRMFQYGKGRAQSKLLDIQVLLPASIPILVLSSVFLPLYVIILIGMYLLTILSFSILLSAKNKKPQFLLTIPLIALLQHISYSLGFWDGILKRGK
jgi:glycosyltransferase involved in cell wall biosynthesis